MTIWHTLSIAELKNRDELQSWTMDLDGNIYVAQAVGVNALVHRYLLMGDEYVYNTTQTHLTGGHHSDIFWADGKLGVTWGTDVVMVPFGGGVKVKSATTPVNNYTGNYAVADVNDGYYCHRTTNSSNEYFAVYRWSKMKAGAPRSEAKVGSTVGGWAKADDTFQGITITLFGSQPNEGLTVWELTGQTNAKADQVKKIPKPAILHEYDVKSGLQRRKHDISTLPMIEGEALRSYEPEGVGFISGVGVVAMFKTGSGQIGEPDERDLRLVVAIPDPKGSSELMAIEYGPKALYAVQPFVKKYLPSAEQSGVVGNAAHKAGYHRARSKVPSTDYSVQAPADKRGDPNAASAFDIKMSPRDMQTATARLMKACVENDPRIEPVREFFGTLNGSKVTGYNRYSRPGVADRAVGYTSSDSSHLWHIHVSVFREYANDAAKMQGVADVIAGLPLKVDPPPVVDAPPVVPDTPVVKPPVAPPVVKPAKPKISLKAAQAGMKAGGKGEPSPEVKLIQKALKVPADGYYGPKSRTAGANYQVKISDNPKPVPWPKAGWDSKDGKVDGTGDADGILGRQSLGSLGFEVIP